MDRPEPLSSRNSATSPSTEAILHAIRSGKPSFIGQRLAYGAFISTRYRYLFVETAKSGATTTKTLLWQIEGYGPVPGPDRIHARPPDDPRPSPITAPLELATAALFSGSYVRFCLWRDPVRRLASAFRDKVHLGRDTAPVWAGQRKAIAAAFGLADPGDVSFDQFATFACSQPDHQRDPHWMSQWRLSLADWLDYDFVVRLDSYAADMARVLEAIGVPRQDWPNLDTRLHTSDSDRTEIGERTAAMIRQVYARDYDLVRRAAG